MHIKPPSLKKKKKSEYLVPVKSMLSHPNTTTLNTAIQILSAFCCYPLFVITAFQILLRFGSFVHYNET